MMTELLAPLYDLNWENLDAVNCTASMVLKKLATDKALLRSKLEGVANDPELLSMAEHYDILDKVVLHNDHALCVIVGETPGPLEMSVQRVEKGEVHVADKWQARGWVSEQHTVPAAAG